MLTYPMACWCCCYCYYSPLHCCCCCCCYGLNSYMDKRLDSLAALKLKMALLLYLLRCLVYWQGWPSFGQWPFFCWFYSLSCYIRTKGHKFFINTRTHTHAHNCFSYTTQLPGKIIDRTWGFWNTKLQLGSVVVCLFFFFFNKALNICWQCSISKHTHKQHI